MSRGSRKTARTSKPSAAALTKQLAKARAELDAAQATIAKLRAELEAKHAKAEPPPASLREFRSPPEDPLAAQAELYRMLVLSAYDAATDEKITAATRRKEIRTITAAAAKLIPKSRVWEAEQLIKADRAELEQRARAKLGAKLEKL